jgi:pyruvate/2-oxoglutarate dehydrogenase complex dihydrolipoamide acyltransferase (E2) component
MVMRADEADAPGREHARQGSQEEPVVSAIAPIEPKHTTELSSRQDSAAGEPASHAWEREQLTDRLRSVRRMLPVLAQEMAAARRQAAHLRLDNRRLTEQVRELRAQLEAREAGSR